jgi:DNA excision repair protein ERCC-6-like 2
MVIYDLDGSETDSQPEWPEAGPSKLPPATKEAAADLPSQNAVQLGYNRQNVAEAHEAVSYSSPSAGHPVDLSEYGDNEPPRKRSKPIQAEPERVQWSDDGSSNDGEAVYKKFKARKSKARKLAVKSGKKARTIEAENAPASSRKQDGTGVGKQAKRKGRSIKTREKAYEDASSDDDLMEWTVPDYLKERRARFDERMEHLKQGGLKLPPEYDDLYFSDDEMLEHLKERPDFPLLKPCARYADIPLPYSLGLIPAPIAQWLRDYQVKGAEFLHELFVYQRGGILADDMGLGKTVQVIAFLAAAYGKTGDERDRKRMRKSRNDNPERWYPRTLIICPGTLMSNWQDELHRWGWWHVDVYHGSTASKDAAISAAQSGRIEILITTYTTYRNYKGAINMVPWDCVVADECHMLKERKSETTQAMNEVNALCRIGLTGTAIQNKYEELWTLLNWTNPGRFGPVSTWKASICEPLKLGQSHDATVYQLSRARKTAKKLVENLLPQFFLRRMKTLIKDQLPKKSDRVVFCPLTKTQSSAYENYLDSEIVQMIKNSGDSCDCGSGKKAGWCCHTTLEDGAKWQTWVFPAITTLQKLSNHLAILIPQGVDPPDKQAKDLENLQIALPGQWEELYRNRDSILNYANPEFCGKWRILRKLLKFWHDEGGNKVLVFSHSVRLLKMLQMLFTSTSYAVAYLDGAMKYEDRYKVVADFNSDPTQFVFLISTKAGGVGLNITSANKVVVVDPNWNPSYDLQAQDRAYRIGQTRDVEVFRLISQGTLEEIVYARQIYKQQQASIGYNASSERRYFQGVQDRKDQKGEIFGLTNLFAYQGESVVLRDIVNKLNISESRAGVRLASLELDEDNMEEKFEDEGQDVHQSFKSALDKEDAAISQLAAEIIGYGIPLKGRKNPKALSANGSTAGKKHDPIQAILSSVGVQYTHENSEVIGSSRIEAQLSKRAEEDTAEGETHRGEARVFFEDSQSQAQGNEGAGVNGPGGVWYRYKPPEEVRRRIFCTMAKWAGYEDPVGFALVVEGWTQANRRDFLTDFYQWRRDVLRGEAHGKDKGDAKIQGGVEIESKGCVKSEDDDDDEL